MGGVGAQLADQYTLSHLFGAQRGNDLVNVGFLVVLAIQGPANTPPGVRLAIVGRHHGQGWRRRFD